MRKLITGLTALVALAVCMAAPALASASPVLTDPEGTPLKVGALIEGTNTEPIVFTGSNGTNVTCNVSTLTGDVIENSGNSITGTITKATFTNAGGAKCSSNGLGEITVTTEIAKVDWCIKTDNTMEDKFKLQAGGCGGAAAVLKFSLDTSFGITCKYARAAASPVEGSYVTGTDVVSIGTGEQSKFTLESGFGCPASGSLDGAYTLETDETTTPVIIS